MRTLGGVALDEFGESHLLSQFSQGFTAHQLRTGIGEEALALVFEMLEYNMSHHGIEQGIAQELKSFVVQGASLVVSLSATLMGQRNLIILDIVGIEANDGVKRRKKLLLLAERELYTVDDIVKPHTS